MADSLEWANEQYQIGVRSLSRRGGFGTDSQEIALSAFNNATTVYTRVNNPERWASIMLELGTIHSLRSEGGKSENTRRAIDYYTQALQVFRRGPNPREWAACHRGLGKAFLRLWDGRDSTLQQRSLLHFETALEVITKDRWPELWHVIHLELSVLFRKHSLKMDNETLRVAWDHYRMAFDFDKQASPGLYESMMHLHLLYSELSRIQQEIGEGNKGKSGIH
jgi:hypothetical protein